MTLGIAVLMSSGIVLVADTRVSRGWRVLADNAEKILQLDERTGVIHSGKVVEEWKDDLKQWHERCIARAKSGWLQYLGCIQESVGSEWRGKLLSGERVNFILARWDGWLGPVGAQLEVERDRIGAAILFLRDMTQVRVMYTGETYLVDTHFNVSEVFRGTSSLDDAIQRSRWLINKAAEIQELKGMPRTIGTNVSILTITPAGAPEET